MILHVQQNAIITLKLRGNSNRAIAKKLGIDRKTVARYWVAYHALESQLDAEGDNRETQERMVAPPKYDASGRHPLKYTEEIAAALREILASEEQKAKELGENHKQKLTNRQIYGLLREAGHDIGLTTIAHRIQEMRRKEAEAFIRQEYDYGQSVTRRVTV